MRRETTKVFKKFIRGLVFDWSLIDSEHIEDALATDAEVRRLKREKAAQRRALDCFERRIRYLFDAVEAETIINEAKEAAVKPAKPRRGRR